MAKIYDYPRMLDELLAETYSSDYVVNFLLNCEKKKANLSLAQENEILKLYNLYIVPKGWKNKEIYHTST
jgi:hypothetical protein